MLHGRNHLNFLSSNKCNNYNYALYFRDLNNFTCTKCPTIKVQL